jgi:hypothetical protein
VNVLFGGTTLQELPKAHSTGSSEH